MHLKAHIFTCATYTYAPAYMGVLVCLYGFQVGLYHPRKNQTPAVFTEKQTPLMNSVTVAKCQTSVYTNATSEFKHSMYTSS